MLVYLDTCSIQRPLDTKNQTRILLEAEAILALLDLVSTGNLELLSSDVLLYEIERNPHYFRRRYGLRVLEQAQRHVVLDDAIISQGKSLEDLGLKPLDALHVASAISVQADRFCTCDDKILNRASSLDTRVGVVNPVELLGEVESWP